MAVPTKKHSKARRNKRRSHDSLTPPTLIPCPQCSERKPPHRICPFCGYYKKAVVIETE